ncbi:MAG: hypothetical protein QXP41_00555 [Candidatus Nitrosocaldus sp.]
MLLSTKDGIYCDICGTIYKDQFTYFSWESNEVVVNPPNVSKHGKDLDIDVCEKCYIAAENKVRQFISNKVIPGTIKCDFCTNVMKGSFIYHKFIIHKVHIDRNKQANGASSVDMNYMDFNIDDACFKDLVNLVTNTRQKIKQSGVWS